MRKHTLGFCLKNILQKSFKRKEVANPIFLCRTTRAILYFIISIYSLSCNAQKAGDMSVCLSTDYGFGKDFNNYASTIHFNYNLFKEIRISPSFSYFLNKENRKMNMFALNFNYMLYDVIENSIPAMRNQEICFYPIMGFCITNVSKLGYCKNCEDSFSSINSNYVFNFGFNFGAGVDYEIPTMLPVLRDMSANFELQYHALDKFSRPLVSFGLLYHF